MRNKYITRLVVFSISILFLNSCIFKGNNTKKDINADKELICEKLPEYEESNQQMVLIQTPNDWRQINIQYKKYFFVCPGNYTSLGEIQLQANGTSEEPRWLIFYNPNSENSIQKHPVFLQPEERASVRRLKVTGNNWRIVGIYGEGFKNQDRSSIIALDGDSNVVNSVLVEYGSCGGGLIQISGDYNIVKNCVVRNTMITPGKDNHGIVFETETDYSQVYGCEIYNCAGDGIQVHPSNDVHKGCIIKDNDIYIDPAKYFEKLDSFPHENGIDFKDGGAKDSTDWIRVVGNRIAWIGSSEGGTGGSAGAIDFSNASGHKAYILFEKNVFYECPLPFTTATGSEGGSSNHLSVINNIFYKPEIAAICPWSQMQFSQEYYFNTIIDVQENGFWIDADITYSDIMGNLVINGQTSKITRNKGVDVNLNFLYNTNTEENDHSLVLKSSEIENFGNYCFTFMKYTSPAELCIPHAIPVKNTFNSSISELKKIGANKDRGVDDREFNQTWAGALIPVDSN